MTTTIIVNNDELPFTILIVGECTIVKMDSRFTTLRVTADQFEKIRNSGIYWADAS